jgi:hypothetical protein
MSLPSLGRAVDFASQLGLRAPRLRPPSPRRARAGPAPPLLAGPATRTANALASDSILPRPATMKARPPSLGCNFSATFPPLLFGGAYADAWSSRLRRLLDPLAQKRSAVPSLKVALCV